MNTTNEREHDLQTLLRQRADAVDVPGDFAPVAIARRRRDQRTKAALGAAAAVAAVAVAVPMLWSPQGGRGVTPAPASTSATSLPSTTSSPVPTETAGQPTAGPSGTATGSATGAPGATPENTYALDDTIRVGDRTIALEKGTIVESLAVLANGGFVLESRMPSADGPTDVELLSPEGRTVKVLGGGGSWVVSRDGTRLLFKSTSVGTLTVLTPDGGTVATRKDGREPATIIGDLAYLSGPDGSLEWNIRTGATRALPADLVAVSDDRTRAVLHWTVPTEAMDDLCWAVVDLTRPAFPKVLERCGGNENPTSFVPGRFSRGGTYLVGSNYVDGGFWFSAAVVRVSDGTLVLGGIGERVVSGWSWRLDDDESTFRISRNTSTPLSPATSNALQQCTLTLECTAVGPEAPTRAQDTFPEPRYVVPR